MKDEGDKDDRDDLGDKEYKDDRDDLGDKGELTFYLSIFTLHPALSVLASRLPEVGKTAMVEDEQKIWA